MKYFFLFCSLVIGGQSFSQQQYTFKRNPDGSIVRDSTAKTTEEPKKKKTVVDAWEDGRRMTPEEAKEATKLPNVSRRFEITGDTVYMHYKLMSSAELADAVEKEKTKVNNYRNEFVGKKTPVFSVKDINGKLYSVDALKGKTVVLNFWFIGCMPCRREMPALKEISEKYKKENIVFLSFALDKEAELKEFISKNNFGYEVVAESGDLAKQFKVTAYPTHFIIDKNGIVKELMVGATDDIKEKLTAAIDKSL